jgi:hypothetical protein
MSDFKIGPCDFRTLGSGYEITGPVTRKLTPKLLVRQNPFALVDNQIANVQNDIAVWSLPIRIYGSGATPGLAAADMAAKISVLNIALTAEPNPNAITDSLDYSGSPETLYQMVKSDAILPGRQDLTEKRHVYEDTIAVRTFPFGSAASGPVSIYLPTDTLTRLSAFRLCGYSDPDSDADPVAIPLEGDLPVPLSVTIAATGIIDAICAIMPAGANLSDYYFSASHTGGVGELVDYTVTPAGRFRVLARISTGTANSWVGIGQDGASAAYQQVAITRHDETAETYDLGEFSSSGGTELQIFVTKGSATVSNVILVPVDVSCVSAWGLPGVSTVTFAANANTYPGSTIGNGLSTPTDERVLLVVVDPPNIEATVTVTYTPLLYGWASS